MNYYKEKPRYWRNCALWTEEEVKFLLIGRWPETGETVPNSLGITLIEASKVETLCLTNESGVQECLEIQATERTLECPVPSDVTLSQLIEDAVSAGLLTPVPFAGHVRYARHLVNKFRPDDVIRWANKLGCFPDFPFCTDADAAEHGAEPAPVTDTAPPKPAAPVPVVAASDAKPWLSIDPQDPAPAQPWYTPARYFARQLTIEKPALLANRALLADKVSTALFNAGFKKRGDKQRFDSGTVLKAFANVSLV